MWYLLRHIITKSSKNVNKISVKVFFLIHFSHNSITWKQSFDSLINILQAFINCLIFFRYHVRPSRNNKRKTTVCQLQSNSTVQLSNFLQWRKCSLSVLIWWPLATCGYWMLDMKLVYLWNRNVNLIFLNNSFIENSHTFHPFKV